ncbi:dihydrolipoamide dehydrogenase [Enterococcus sp. ZJ1668]|uniref:dihydrolipoamide dehydrogenase n=1 Tax=Enterococcus sp. ZJ1668 TaxID=2709402 RepID=UPI00197E9893|nr:dihydrolipoamide dehydrogenase [Enterococcus sp. ZJ1668]
MRTVGEPVYFKVGKAKKRAICMQQLCSKENGQRHLAIVFEDQSYVIVNAAGKAVEYCPTTQGYFEWMENPAKWEQTETEEMPDWKDWIKAEEPIPVLIEEKRAGQEPTECWIGLPEQRFSNYKDWKTPAGYLCGTYAAAVLLAYYQDYRDDVRIPQMIREKSASDPQNLVPVLRQTIQPHGLPTVPFQVSAGVTSFLGATGNDIRARSTVIGSWQRATKRIRQGKPVMIGILRALGSTYGNHWVTAYAYFESASGERYYKVHDNWGDFQRVIPASWSNGTVSLP